MFLSESELKNFEHSYLHLVKHEEHPRFPRVNASYFYRPSHSDETSVIDVAFRSSIDSGNDYVSLEVDSHSHHAALEMIGLQRKIQSRLENDPKRRLLYVTGERTLRVRSPINNLDRWEKQFQQLLIPSFIEKRTQYLVDWLENKAYKDCSHRIERLIERKSTIEIDVLSGMRKPTLSFLGESGKQVVEFLCDKGYGEEFYGEDGEHRQEKKYRYDFYLYDTDSSNGLFNYTYFHRFHHKVGHALFDTSFGGHYKSYLRKTFELNRDQRKNLV